MEVYIPSSANNIWIDENALAVIGNENTKFYFDMTKEEFLDKAEYLIGDIDNRFIFTK